MADDNRKSRKADAAVDGSLILDSIADGVFSVDKRMKITSFNRAAELITGFSREDAVGRYCHEVFCTDVCTTRCPMKEALDSGQAVVNRDVDIITRDGKKRPISISASALRDQEGKVIGGVETFRDLSKVFELKKEVQRKYSFHDLVSRNPNMLRLFDVLPDIAASEATVLLKGESGTGKELFAKALHDLSNRSSGPLVIINCGALPEPLLEAEIFGARRGAYTGAVENRPGRLEMAEGGTLFLDEIGDLPLPLQVKLLRVLENHEFQPLGAKSPQKANVRFLAATNCDLESMVERGTFRRDLFFRVNVVSLQIPALRERREDIPLLIDVFLDRYIRAYGKNIRGFTPEVTQILMNHDYPGNIRELLNIVEQTVILCRGGEIGVEHLPSGFLSVNRGGRTMLQTKRGKPSKEILESLLVRYSGSRQHVAQELGVDRTTLWRWMKRFGLSE